MNPATLLPLDSKRGEDTSENDTSMEEHNCVEVMNSELQGLENVTEVPLHNPNFEFFVDGSRYCVDGQYRTGYAVVTLQEVITQKPLPPSCSHRRQS